MRSSATVCRPPSCVRAVPALRGPGARRSSAVADHIACATNRMQQLLAEALVDLRSQSRNVHVDHVGLWIEMIVPDILEEHRPGDHLPRMLHEIFQQPELPWLQDDFLSRAGHLMRKTIEFEIAG